MAGRVTSLGDVAAAMIAAATAPAIVGTGRIRLRLVIPMLARSVTAVAASRYFPQAKDRHHDRCPRYPAEAGLHAQTVAARGIHRRGEARADDKPHNHPGLSPHVLSEDGGIPSKAQIAVLTTNYWGAGGVDLTVSFLDQRGEKNRGFRDTVLRHMNAWAANPRPGAAPANIRFRGAGGSADVRITTQPGGGHWSYIGTDIHMIRDLNRPTMNLDGFSSFTSESEFCRVVRHETGHTLGCPHEHMRGDLIKLIDVEKAKAFYFRTQQWTPEQTMAQVPTPLEEGSLLGTERADPTSIMCYQIPPELTTHGQPILGGADIDTSDYDFITRMYPRPIMAAAPVVPAAPVERAAAPRDRRSAIAATHIIVAMPGDIDVSIPPDATQAQIRHVLKALD